VGPELYITRHNELIDPAVAVWSWQIPVYLFLGGWVAGMMILTGLSLVRGRYAERSCVCSALPVVGLTLLSLGTFALFLDLEHKWYVWRLYTTFEASSPMSWGAWILLFVYPVLAVTGLVRPPALTIDLSRTVRHASDWLQSRPQLVRALGVLSLALGAALGIYTGILLSSLGARPLWASGLLGPLFLVSGLSTAAAFTHLVARDPRESRELAIVDNMALAAEMGLLALLMLGLLAGGEAQSAAAGLFMGGAYTAPFWVLVVAMGIVAPLIIQTLAVTHRIPHTPVAPLLVMAGGLALRFIFVQAGQVSHWAHGVSTSLR
jgi:protein NrfD